MPSTNHDKKRLLYLTPENVTALTVRAPRVPGGRQINLPLNSIIQRYDGMCRAALARVWSALPEERDRAFIRFVLMGVATDDLTVAENPLAYIHEIEEAAAEYERGEEPFTPALLSALRCFNPMEAVALADWIEREKAL